MVFIKVWARMVSNMESRETMMQRLRVGVSMRLGKGVWLLLDVSYPCMVEIDYAKPLNMALFSYIAKVAK